MPHLRKRFATGQLAKLSKLWPAVGLIGPRQSGKTTIFRDLLGLGSIISFDDLRLRDQAQRGPRIFLEKLKNKNGPPVLDEAQKAPEIFDAIKLIIDSKRIPGSFFLTGSTQFSARAGVRENLTGRIGTLELLPLTLAEMGQKEFVKRLGPIQTKFTPRFTMGQVLRAAQCGGMPVPSFLRDTEERNRYWSSWLEASIFRDLARLFPRGYDPERAFSVLEQMGKVLREGELPTLKHFDLPSPKLRNLLSAMEEIFLVRRIRIHEKGIGTDAWLFFDSGLASYLMRDTEGEGATLSLIRHWLWNEWLGQHHYIGRRPNKVFFKSAKGSPVDWIDDGIAYKVVASEVELGRRRDWAERPLRGAMKTLGIKYGYLVGPNEEVEAVPKAGGVGILPWTYWS